MEIKYNNIDFLSMDYMCSDYFHDGRSPNQISLKLLFLIIKKDIMETLIIIILVAIALYIIFRIFKLLLKWLLIGVIVLLVIAFFSNPDESNYAKTLKEITNRVPVEIKDDALQVHDYKVFSIAKIRKGGEEKIVGIGAFGKVWYFDDFKAQLKE
jgi:hypothetical protein